MAVTIWTWLVVFFYVIVAFKVNTNIWRKDHISLGQRRILKIRQGNGSAAKIKDNKFQLKNFFTGVSFSTGLLMIARTHRCVFL